jgi:hypothetical protein
MGGSGAPNDMDQAHRTLAVSDDPSAQVTDQYFYHPRRRAPNLQARDTDLQDRIVAEGEHWSSVRWPD